MPLEKQVWDVMTTQYKAVTPETPLKDACGILAGTPQAEGTLPGLVVMRASGEYLGVLSVKDILRYLNFIYDQSLREKENWIDRLLNKCADESLLTVNDVMSRFDLTVRPNQKIIEAILTMLEEDVDLLPVEDSGRIIGVVCGGKILEEISNLMPQGPRR